MNECFILCYFMYFDPISSRIWGPISALFLVVFVKGTSAQKFFVIS